MEKKTDRSQNREIGRRGEELAAAYLRRQGMEILQRNYTVRGGEIDLVARDGDCTVFVEVKTRRGSGFGTGREAVTLRKRKALTRAALRFAAERGIVDTPMRFDIIEILQESSADVKIDHFPNAFEAEGSEWM